MTTIQNTPNLPARTPDLVIVNGDGRRWRIENISHRLALFLGISPDDAPGKAVGTLFPETVPSLVDLADDVVKSEKSLRNLQVRFALTGKGTFLVDAEPAGLSEDYRYRRVAFSLREGGEETPLRSVYGMIGASPAMREVFRKVALYAPSDAPAVITGETGTGKELVARALHEESRRRRHPYVAVNCSAISEDLLESELFGHEKGAFTGAVRSHRGRFERADGGTLFLDEIGDMPIHTQAKLLRALEEGRIERVGSEEEQKVDVRVLSATNVPLEQVVGRGGFRSDLYHRLSVLRIHLPPLRQRPEDIPLLVDHFLETFRQKYGRHIERLTHEAILLLQSYLWPGNVRELRNVLERVFVETHAEAIGARAFREWIRERRDFAVESSLSFPSPPKIAPPYPLPSEQRLLTSSGGGAASPGSPRNTRPAELDPEEIRRAYTAASGNISAAARLLGVHRATLYRYMRRLGLARNDL